MAGQVGITFKPTEQQSLLGPKQGGKEGLQQAIQLLSFRYPNPRVSGSQSIVGDPRLLGSPSTPRVGGFNPNAAILQALIQAFSGGGGSSSLAGPSLSRESTLPQFTPVDPQEPHGSSRLPTPTRVDENAPDSVTRAYDPMQLQTAFQRPSYQDQLQRKYGGGY